MYEKKILKDFSCGMAVTLEIIGGKWKPCLIDSIHQGIRRPSKLHRANPTASRRVLNLQLKELVAHQVVERVMYPELPLRVEYFLTDFGKSLLPLLRTMKAWGNEHRDTFTAITQSHEG